MTNSFKNWTQLDVEKVNSRRKPQESIPTGGDKCVERLLHYQILEECERRGWIVFHGSMAHRTHRTVGEFDFTILADMGRVFLVEVKSKTGKLTEEQAGMHCWAKKLGHTPHVVRSLQEFLEVVK